MENRSTTLTVDYNERGLVKAYSVGGFINAAYEYDPDGMIKLAHSHGQHEFDDEE